jgi:hypothetical protein
MSDKQFSPLQQPEHEAEDDSMQLKRDRLGAEVQEENEHLSYVDRLLRSAPMLSAPLGFAERVIARLKADPPRVIRYEEGTGIVLGLGAAAFIFLPILMTVAIVLGLGVVNEDFRETTWETAGEVLTSIADAIAASPVLTAGLIIMLMLFLGASGYFMWFWRGLIRTARRLRTE